MDSRLRGNDEPMKVIFAGTPEFAASALQALLDMGSGSSIEVPLVLTQPDRPAGRGLKLQPSAVKQLALKHGVAVAQPLSLRLDGKYPDDAAAAKKLIEEAKADFMVVAAYGLILPQWALDAPKHGCLNIHASLLPRWRGAAPIHRAIEAGDTQTGITIMQMDAGLDTGAMLAVEAIPIAADDTTQTLHDKLAQLGASLIQQALQSYAELIPIPQPAEGATYAAKITKSESAIDWSQSAAVIERKIRALNPAPGCTTELNGETVKVWRAEVVDDKLRILELQRPGGKRMTMADYLRGLKT
jgi:methionyl-tRNA formyltransferase